MICLLSLSTLICYKSVGIHAHLDSYCMQNHNHLREIHSWCSFNKIAAGVKKEGEQGGNSSTRGSNIQMMSEQEYIDYCKKYTEQMGMPFDEGMVRNHYEQMKKQFAT